MLIFTDYFQWNNDEAVDTDGLLGLQGFEELQPVAFVPLDVDKALVALSVEGGGNSGEPEAVRIRVCHECDDVTDFECVCVANVADDIVVLARRGDNNGSRRRLTGCVHSGVRVNENKIKTLRVFIFSGRVEFV
jgi:hypothetical protein